MVAVITPLYGRHLWWEWWLQGFESLDFERGHLCVFWLNDSEDPEFEQFLTSYVAEHRYEYRQFELRPGRRSGTGAEQRAAACYDELRKALLESGESFANLLTYQDDVIPPPDGLQRLQAFLATHPTAAAVGGAVPYHDQQAEQASLLAWHFGQGSGDGGLVLIPYEASHAYRGAEEVDAVGLGFALLRDPAFLRTSLHHSAMGLSFEQLLGWEARQRGERIFCLGDVRCWHHQIVDGKLLSSFPERRSSCQPDRHPEPGPGLERHIAILTPFSGKDQVLDVFLQRLDALDWEPDRLHLLWLDNSNSPAFGERLEAALEERRRRFASACLLREDRVIGPKYAQVPFLYRKLRESIPQGIPYVFCWEDDVLIPARTLRVLQAELTREEDIGAVSGSVPYYRPGPPESIEVLLWRYDSLEPAPDSDAEDTLRIGVGEAPYHYFGTSEIDASGFGCLLTHRHLFDSTSLLAERFGINHDQIYGWELRLRGYRFLGVWHIACQHLQPDQEDRLRPVHLPTPQLDGLRQAGSPIPASVARQEYPSLLLDESPNDGKYLFLVDEQDRLGEDYLAALVEALEADDNLSHTFGLVLQGERVVPVRDGAYPWRGPVCSVFRRDALEQVANWEQLLRSQAETLTGELLRNSWRCRQVPEVRLHQDQAPIAPRLNPARYVAEYQRRQRRPLSVLFQSRLRTWSGGDLVHMDGLQQALRGDGFTADFRPVGFRSIRDWDIVHLMHIAFPWSIHIAECCIEQGHPYVVSSILHDVDSLPDLQTVGSHASAIIAASEGEKQALLSYCPGFEAKIVVIPLGLDPSWFVVPAEPVDPGERYVLCVGRYEPQKRQQAVLESCRQLDVRVIFVGGPDCSGSWGYYDEVVAEGYAKATFLRQVPLGELQGLFYGAHVVCHASEYESFGLTGIEAAAAGANLVMTNRTLAIDQFEWAGFCDPDSINSIVTALGEQYEAPRVPKPRPLSWAEVTRRILPIYLSALGSRNC